MDKFPLMMKALHELEIEETFDPEERAKEKKLSREKDIFRLNSGEVSAIELNKENGFFSGIDFSNAKIIRRKRKIKLVDE